MILRRILARSTLGLALATTVIGGLPAPAWACGGCFGPDMGASATPAPAPIQQVGERVLFVADPEHGVTRVWIEIRYNGPSSAFAWVLPLPKVPKVGVGESWLFDRLDLATLPRFQVQQGSDENCEYWQPPAKSPGRADSRIGTSRSAPPRPESQDVAYAGGCGGGSLTSSGAGYSVSSQESYTSGAGGYPAAAQADESDLKRSSKVQLKAHDQTGPYDYVVIDSKDPKALTAWLNSNGYAVPAEAGPIIAAHVAKGDVFLAVRLANPTGVQEIKPIALEMPTVEACVPLRLTSIAAVQDTSVVVFLAGPARALPKNTLHVTPNPVRLNWLGGASNYQQVLSAAIDEAGGHAFTTEFSGPINSLQVPSLLEMAQRRSQYGDQLGLYEPGPALRLPRSAAGDLAKVENLAGLTAFLQQYDVPIDAASVAILEPVVHLAATLKQQKNPVDVYLKLKTGLRAYDGLLYDLPVQGKLLVQRMAAYLPPPPPETAAIAPMLAALQQQRTLTRLALFISPEEMDRDPQFAFDSKLPNVDNEHTVRANYACTDGWYPSNRVRVTVPDLGSWLTVNGGLLLDSRFSSAPAALQVELLDEVAGAKPVAPTQVDLVDTAIAGAKPGFPSLPAGTVLKPATGWQPPPSDATLTGKVYGGGLGVLRSPQAQVAALLLAVATAIWLRRRRAELDRLR